MEPVSLAGISVHPTSIVLFALCLLWLVLYLRRLFADLRRIASLSESTLKSRRRILLRPSIWEPLLWLSVLLALLTLAGDSPMEIITGLGPSRLALLVAVFGLPLFILGSYLPRSFLAQVTPPGSAAFTPVLPHDRVRTQGSGDDAA